MSETTPDGWPPDVTPIGLEDLDKLGLNARNQLVWDGKRIEVRNRVDLTRLQTTFAIGAGRDGRVRDRFQQRPGFLVRSGHSLAGLSGPRGFGLLIEVTPFLKRVYDVVL